MKNIGILNQYYREAVKELNEAILLDKAMWYAYVINLPMHLQITYTIIVFHKQVNNGGLHQYFFNSYGIFCHITCAHLELIKAFKTSSILERAINQVNIENFCDELFREKIFNREIIGIVSFDDKLCDYLDLLDNEYYDSDEDVLQLLVDYVENC